MKSLRIALIIGLLVAVSSCGSGDDSATTSPASTPSTSQSATTTESSATTSTSTSIATPPSTATPTTPTTTTSVVPTLTDVKIYLLRDERLAIVHRLVPGPAVLRGALTELLAGPTDAERADGLGSEVPLGTELLDVDLVDGLGTVDLSSDFESGGGVL